MGIEELIANPEAKSLGIFGPSQPVGAVDTVVVVV